MTSVITVVLKIVGIATTLAIVALLAAALLQFATKIVCGFKPKYWKAYRVYLICVISSALASAVLAAIVKSPQGIVLVAIVCIGFAIQAHLVGSLIVAEDVPIGISKGAAVVLVQGVLSVVCIGVFYGTLLLSSTIITGSADPLTGRLGSISGNFMKPGISISEISNFMELDRRKFVISVTSEQGSQVVTAKRQLLDGVGYTLVCIGKSQDDLKVFGAKVEVVGGKNPVSYASNYFEMLVSFVGDSNHRANRVQWLRANLARGGEAEIGDVWLQVSVSTDSIFLAVNRRS